MSEVPGYSVDIANINQKETNAYKLLFNVLDDLSQNARSRGDDERANLLDGIYISLKQQGPTNDRDWRGLPDDQLDLLLEEISRSIEVERDEDQTIDTEKKLNTLNKLKDNIENKLLDREAREITFRRHELILGELSSICGRLMEEERNFALSESDRDRATKNAEMMAKVRSKFQDLALKDIQNKSQNLISEDKFSWKNFSNEELNLLLEEIDISIVGYENQIRLAEENNMGKQTSSQKSLSLLNELRKLVSTHTNLVS